MHNCIQQNIGIDVSKDSLAVCFSEKLSDQRIRIKGTRKFKNTVLGFKELISWVEKRRIEDVLFTFTLEATGVYYEELAYFLYNKDYELSVLLPNKSKAYFKSLNIKTKTDKTDSKVLARMGLERKLKRWEPLSDQMRTLKLLTRERVTIQVEKTAVLNRLHALKHSYQVHRKVLTRLQQRLRLIQKQLDQVDKDIEQVVETDQQLAQRIRNVCQLKGLGVITVATIVAELNGFTLFTNRAQLTSYAGYDVIENQSGSSIRGKTRISKKGNRFIRRALFFPAIVAIKHEEEFRNLYDRVYERTRIKMKAYVAVQRKLLLLIYTLFKNNTAYDSNYYKRVSSENKSRQDTVPAYTG